MCGGIEIPVHRVILSSASKKFEDLFTLSGYKVDIKILDADILLLLLEFVYCGEIAEEKITLKLFKTAIYFAIEGLVHLCVKYLDRSMYDQNAVDCFIVGLKYHNKYLKNAAGLQILQNYYWLRKKGEIGRLQVMEPYCFRGLLEMSYERVDRIERLRSMTQLL